MVLLMAMLGPGAGAGAGGWGGKEPHAWELVQPCDDIESIVMVQMLKHVCRVANPCYYTKMVACPLFLVDFDRNL